VRDNNGTVMRGEKVDKLQEYATEAQIEFFDRLRSGDDPVHEGARTELVKLADQALELLQGSASMVASEPGTQRVRTKLAIIAGHPVEEFTLDVYVEGYDPSDDQLMADLTDAAKGRFTDEQKLALALLNNPEVELVDTDSDEFENTRTFYFSTYHRVVAEKYGFMGEAEREAEAEAARVAAEKHRAEWDAKNAAAREATEALINEKGLEGAFTESYQALVAAKGEAASKAIRTAVECVAKDDVTKQIMLLGMAVTA
jgi:hypothetical protein